MRDLTRNEMAAIKRVAATTKSLRTKRDKLYAKVNDLKKLIADLDAEILILASQAFPYWQSQSAYHLLPAAHGDLYPHSPYRPYAQPPH